MSETNPDIEMQETLDELIQAQDLSNLIDGNTPIIDSLLNQEIEELLENTSFEESSSDGSPTSSQFRVYFQSVRHEY